MSRQPCPLSKGSRADYKQSVIGAINVLRLAKRTKARILQVFPSEVDGDPEVHSQTEDYRGRVNPHRHKKLL